MVSGVTQCFYRLHSKRNCTLQRDKNLTIKPFPFSRECMMESYCSKYQLFNVFTVASNLSNMLRKSSIVVEYSALLITPDIVWSPHSNNETFSFSSSQLANKCAWEKIGSVSIVLILRPKS